MTEKEILEQKIAILKKACENKEIMEQVLREEQQKNQDLWNPNFANRDEEEEKPKQIK